jgi:ABC-type transporter Mla MlaB component
VGVEAANRVVLIVSGPLTPADGPRLCAELVARISGAGATEAVCDVRGLVRPGLAAVDALARLRLTANRHGCRLLIVGARRELLVLLDMAGLGGLAGPGGLPSLPG